jgi:hypothetical protein
MAGRDSLTPDAFHVDRVSSCPWREDSRAKRLRLSFNIDSP